MNTEETTTFIILLILSLCAFIICCYQFKGKGFLFNNEYLYASKEERAKMNKDLHYRQSAIVFLFIGIVCLLFMVKILFHIEWLYVLIMFIILAIIIFVVISFIQIEKTKE